MKITKKKEVHILIIKYKDGRIEISKTLNTVSRDYQGLLTVSNGVGRGFTTAKINS